MEEAVDIAESNVKHKAKPVKVSLDGFKFLGWCQRYFPHHFPSEAAQFHFETATLALRHEAVAIAAPRGHAKSTVHSFGRPLYEAAHRRKSFIILVSDTAAQAESLMGDIYGELLENEELTRDYPHLALPEGKDYRKKRTKRTVKDLITLGGIRFLGVGARQKLRGMKKGGKRPDLIIVDDLENDENVYTGSQREKLWNWFTRALLPLPGAQEHHITVLGTILHKKSLLMRLLEQGQQDGSWETRKYAAILPDGSLLWPGNWSVEKLQKRRRSMGSRSFKIEFMNDPSDSESALWQMDWIQSNRSGLDQLAKITRVLVRVVVALDPSATEHGDHCGIIVAGLGSDNRAYVLEDLTLKGKPDEWAQVALSAYKRWRANEIVAEANQGGEMVSSVLRAHCDAVKVSLPRITLVWASKGKRIRAEPIAVAYENNRVSHVGTLEALEEELTSWVLGMESPNRLDALVWALTALLLPDEEQKSASARQVKAALRRNTSKAPSRLMKPVADAPALAASEPPRNPHLRRRKR